MNSLFNAAYVCILVTASVWAVRSALQMRAVVDLLALTREPARGQLTRVLKIHRRLLFLAPIGFLSVGLAILLESHTTERVMLILLTLLASIYISVGVRLQAALARQIMSTLTGILPICSHCKKIRRDEEDRGPQVDWIPIESYVTERSPTRFSHTLCPTCIHELYPEEAAEVEGGEPLGDLRTGSAG